MILLNQIEESKKNEIINLIRDKSLGIRVLSDAECQSLYYQTFRDLKRICKSMILSCFFLFFYSNLISLKNSRLFLFCRSKFFGQWILLEQDSGRLRFLSQPKERQHVQLDNAALVRAHAQSNHQNDPKEGHRCDHRQIRNDPIVQVERKLDRVDTGARSRLPRTTSHSTTSRAFQMQHAQDCQDSGVVANGTTARRVSEAQDLLRAQCKRDCQNSIFGAHVAAAKEIRRTKRVLSKECKISVC